MMALKRICMSMLLILVIPLILYFILSMATMKVYPGEWPDVIQGAYIGGSIVSVLFVSIILFNIFHITKK